MFSEAWLGRALEAERCLPLVDEIADSVGRNPGAMVSLAGLKTQDDYSCMHSAAVCALMVALGQERGLDEAGCREAGLARLLHDLGQVAIPLEILNKPGKLTDAEFAIVRTHLVHGHEMLMEARGASEVTMDVCLHHHERADGGGYPHGLQGDVLSRLARMGSGCDVYDAITSNRPYKAGWDPAESIARMVSWKGPFDDEVFRGFVRSLGIYLDGALVRLQSGRLALEFSAAQCAGAGRRGAHGQGLGGVAPIRPGRARPAGRPGSGSRAGCRHGSPGPGGSACAAWPASARCGAAGRMHGPRPPA